MGVRYIGAIVASAFALSLLPSSSSAEVTVNILDLRRACMVPRSFAMSEMFGANYTQEQAAILDSRLEQELSGKTLRQLAIAYQAFEITPQSRHPEADRYAQCIYGERLRQLDSNADLSIVRRGDYVPPDAAPTANSAWDAALTRRDSNTSAGSAVLAQSADPASRAARARENAALRQQAAASIAEHRQQRDAFWGAVLQAAAIATETYVQVQAAQAQAEADAAAEYSARQAYSSRQQPGEFSQQTTNQQTASPTSPRPAEERVSCVSLQHGWRRGSEVTYDWVYANNCPFTAVLHVNGGSGWNIPAGRFVRARDPNEFFYATRCSDC